jgi:preprotein translocase subunit SecY
MLQALLNAFRIPDLRQKLVFTLALLVAFRFIAHVPMPGVNLVALSAFEHQFVGVLDCSLTLASSRSPRWRSRISGVHHHAALVR